MRKTICLLIFCMIPFVSAYDFVYQINDTQLPYTTSFVGLVFGGEPGQTVNVFYGGNFTSGLNSFIFEQPTFALTVNIRLNRTGNFTDYVSVVNTITNYTNTTTFYASVINTTIMNNTLPTNQTNSTNTTSNQTNTTLNLTNYIQIDFNDFEWNLCDYTLPFNTTKQIIVDGYLGQTVYVDYDINGFIKIPTSFSMPPQNFTSVTAQIYIPANTSVGNYIQHVRFSILSNFSNVTFRFNVNDCVQPPPDVYKRLERCQEAINGQGNLTPEEFLTCINDLATYFSDYYDSLAETQRKQVQNKTRVIYVNDTVYEPVLELKDKDMITALKDLPTKLNQMIVENRNKENKISEVESELETMRQQKEELETTLDDRITTRLQVLIEDTNNKTAQIKKYEEEYIQKKTIVFSIIGFLLLSGIIGLMYYYQYDNLY